MKVTDDTLIVLTIQEQSGMRQSSIYRYGDLPNVLMYSLAGSKKDYAKYPKERVAVFLIESHIASDEEIATFNGLVGDPTTPFEDRVEDWAQFMEDYEDD